MTRSESCLRCRYFDQTENDDDDDEMGLCRRYPRVIIDDGNANMYPVHYTTNWCGEYQSSRSALN